MPSPLLTCHPFSWFPGRKESAGTNVLFSWIRKSLLPDSFILTWRSFVLVRLYNPDHSSKTKSSKRVSSKSPSGGWTRLNMKKSPAAWRIHPTRRQTPSHIPSKWLWFGWYGDKKWLSATFGRLGVHKKPQPIRCDWANVTLRSKIVENAPMMRGKRTSLIREQPKHAQWNNASKLQCCFGCLPFRMSSDTNLIKLRFVKKKSHKPTESRLHRGGCICDQKEPLCSQLCSQRQRTFSSWLILYCPLTWPFFTHGFLLKKTHGMIV